MLLFSGGFECATRCFLCHNVFLITNPEVRCQQAATNLICITCVPFISSQQLREQKASITFNKILLADIFDVRFTFEQLGSLLDMVCRCPLTFGQIDKLDNGFTLNAHFVMSTHTT